MKITSHYIMMLLLTFSISSLVVAAPKQPDAGSDDCYNRATNTCNRLHPGMDSGDKVYTDCINDHLDWCDINEPALSTFLPMIDLDIIQVVGGKVASFDLDAVESLAGEQAVNDLLDQIDSQPTNNGSSVLALRRPGLGNSTLTDHRCLKDDGTNYQSCHSGYTGYTCTSSICEGNIQVRPVFPFFMRK